MDADGNYASIDPAALKGATDSLQKAVDGVTGQLAGLASEFAYFGVATDHLTTLTNAAKTISGLIPELRKRQSMAEQLVAEAPSNGKVAYFQGDLLGAFTTVAAATAQAHIDANAVKHAADSGDPVPDSVYNDLQKYGYDPDYSAAFVGALSAKYMVYLLHGTRYPPDQIGGDAATSWRMRALAQTLAAASYRVNLGPDWIASLQKYMHDAQLPTNEGGAFALVGPLLQYGQWDDKTLRSIGDLALNNKDIDRYGYLPGTEWPYLYRGMANNPLSAGQWFADNKGKLYDLFKYSSHASDPGMQDAQAAFVKAATVDSRSLFALWKLSGGPQSNVAEDNAQWLINTVGGDDYSNWQHPMSMTFAAVGLEYFDDLAYTVGSPIDAGSVSMPQRDGIEVGQAGWTKFLQKTMSDDEAMAQLAVRFSQFQKDQLTYADGKFPGDQHSSQDQANAKYWDNNTVHRMDTLFLNLYATVASQKGRDAQAQSDAINGAIDKAVDWASDPEGIPKDIAKTVIGDTLKSIVGVWTKPEEIPPPPKDLSNVYIYTQAASDAYSHHSFRPYNDGQVTWDGDPTLYEQIYGGTFVKDGAIEPVDEIAKDPKAWQAYNAWLQDPAVQAAVSPTYRDAAIEQGDPLGH